MITATMRRGFLLIALMLISPTIVLGAPPLVRLKGSPYQRGVIHGRTLRNQIQELSRKWKEDLAASAGGNVDAFITTFLSETDFLSAARKWTPDLLEEVRGIADGAGIPQETALAMQLLDELWWYTQQKQESNHCSTIGVARTGGRPTYVAQNMDLEKFRDGAQAVLYVEASDGAPAQLIFTSAGLVALNGINDRSIGVVVNTLAQLRSSPKGLPVAFVIRGVLNRTSEHKALQFLTSVSHASGQNYILGSEDSVYDFEASAGKVVRYEPPGLAGLVFHTNHPLVNDDYSPGYLAQLRKQETSPTRPPGNSVLRLASLDQRLRLRPDRPNLGVITETLRSRDSEFAVCRRLDDAGPIFTFGSTLMTLSSKPVLEVSVGPPDKNDYVSFTFD